jgi:hypothetical protein
MGWIKPENHLTLLSLQKRRLMPSLLKICSCTGGFSIIISYLKDNLRK